MGGSARGWDFCLHGAFWHTRVQPRVEFIGLIALADRGTGPTHVRTNYSGAFDGFWSSAFI